VIVIDTNVISEPVKPRSDPAVDRWLDQQSRESLFLAVTSLTELRVGLETMPRGKRRTQLERALEEALSLYFGPRVLDVTQVVAERHGEIVARARSIGVAIGFADAQIAAIAKTHGYAVATRDVAVFEAAGVEVINPWMA
jgi:hypothetical protein